MSGCDLAGGIALTRTRAMVVTEGETASAIVEAAELANRTAREVLG